MGKKNFIYYLLPSLLKGIIGLSIVIPVSTYYLDPKDFGIIAIISVFSGLIIPLSSIGGAWVLASNYHKLNFKERGELIFNLLFLQILLKTFWVVVFGAAGFLFLPKLIKSYQDEFLLFFWILLLAEWFNSLWDIASYTMILQRESKLHALLEITQMLSNVTVLLVCLVILHLKTVSLALGILGTALGGFISSIICIRRYVVPKIRMKWIRKIVRLGFPTIPLNLFEVVSSSIERFFIERWIGLSKLGIYSHSLSYRQMFMQPMEAFKRTYAPEVLEGVSKGDQAKIESAKVILRKWFGLLTIAGVGVILFSRDAINILTHGKFVEAAPLVSLWFILILIYSLGTSYTPFLLVNMKIKFIFISSIALGIVSWGVTILFVRFFGILGATTASLLYFFSLHLARRVYSVKMGCENFEGSAFMISLFIILGLFILNICSFSFVSKLFIFIIIALLISFYFRLFSLLKPFLISGGGWLKGLSQ